MENLPLKRMGGTGIGQSETLLHRILESFKSRPYTPALCMGHLQEECLWKVIPLEVTLCETSEINTRCWLVQVLRQTFPVLPEVIQCPVRTAAEKER